VKTGFNQRRKKLSNALKPLNIPESLKNHTFMDKRAEELSVEDFINFTKEWKSAINFRRLLSILLIELVIR
jgi:16S rRNA (adenine1518-N6/adenine1519-N6)-dimethyltransferase